MATASLSATSRTGTGKGVARKLRASGKVPAVVYGHARKPQDLSLDTRELERLLERITAASTVIDLAIDGTARKTLIREIQRDPLRRAILHVDFLELVAGEKVNVRVRIAFEGIPAGVRSDGGIFEEVLHEVEIEADPTDIPEKLTVDVTELTIGHSLHVSDLKLPGGVTLVTDPGVTMCICSAPRAEEEVAPPAAEGAEAATATEPELIRKPKEGEEGEAAAEPAEK
ncbi:MAG TPA: 50S ribosomal protein L25/general stress protein Ctc [Gemmatimonadaceae bacterium]|nr:50S ribosomal protein L25/general stress protein Ctc [Gemmatimonadaceae bacterium]